MNDPTSLEEMTLFFTLESFSCLVDEIMEIINRPKTYFEVSSDKIYEWVKKNNSFNSTKDGRC